MKMHTPTPWQRGPYGTIYGVGVMPTIDGGLSQNQAIEIAKVKNGAFGVYDVKPGGLARGNADFIVTAVNAHDDLIHEAKLALEKLRKFVPKDAPECNFTGLIDALSKAGVKP